MGRKEKDNGVRGEKKNKRMKVFVQETIPSFVEAIAHAETHGKKSGAPFSEASGSEKLEMATDWLSDRIEIAAWIPDWMEEMILKFGLTLVVELAKHLWGKQQWSERLQETWVSSTGFRT